MADASSTGFNLTQATHIARLTVKYGGIGLVFLMVGRILLTSFIGFWNAVHPAPPPPPTMGFGSLPLLLFPSQTSDDKPASYSLETASGTLPSFGDRAKVFLMIHSTPSLLADQKAREIAAAYGFVFEPESVDATTYRWKKSQPLAMTLEMNIFNQHFTLSSDYLSRPELIANPNLPDDFQAVTQLKNMLSQADLLPADVATSSGKITYRKSLGGELGEAVSLSDADYLEVDLDRTPIDDLLPMMGPDGKKGAIHAVITGALKNTESVVEMEYNYQAIDYSQIETYPIRTSQEAWKLLQSGEGYVAQKGDGDAAVIRDVTLAYYESHDEQDYLQPIYVFHGDGGFLGYVPAVSPTTIQAK